MLHKSFYLHQGVQCILMTMCNSYAGISCFKLQQDTLPEKKRCDIHGK